MKKMKITLHKDGTQKIEVFGATGDSCLEFTREMENRLGVRSGERVLKPEYDAQAEPEMESETERGS